MMCDVWLAGCHQVDFTRQYWHDVFERCIAEYGAGVTPNPDVWCNRYIKFHWFSEHATQKLGAHFVATGHYAQLARRPRLPLPSSSTNGNGNGDTRATASWLGMSTKEELSKKWNVTSAMANLTAAITDEPVERLIARSVDLLRQHADRWPSPYAVIPPQSSSLSSQSSSNVVMSAHLLSATDGWKDQTYFLALTRSGSLNNAIFPIGHLHKSQVRAIASYAGLPNATKRESMGICMVGKRDFPTFISQYISPRPGHFVALVPPMDCELIGAAGNINTATGGIIGNGNGKDGGMDMGKRNDKTSNKRRNGSKDGRAMMNDKGLTILGHHRGIACYTMGQQANIPGMTQKWYVASKDIERNEIIVVPNRFHAAMFVDRLYLREMTWIHGTPPSLDLHHTNGTYRCLYRTRHHSPLRACTIKRLVASSTTPARHSGAPTDMDTDAEWEIIYDTPHTNTALGQGCVFYDITYVVIITHATPSFFCLSS
jgi:tRNA U34 2-thiouridine synthase MnmA/TrmU